MMKNAELLEESEIELGDYIKLDYVFSNTPSIQFVFYNEPISEFVAHKVKEELKLIHDKMGPDFYIIGLPRIVYEQLII